MILTKRGLIRIGSLFLAFFAAVSVKALMLSSQAQQLRRQKTNSYYSAMEDLAAACEGLKTSLEKQLYATGETRQELAVESYARACEAKAALSRLPVTDLRLENTSKLLSQAGSFSLSLGTSEPTDKDYAALLSIWQYTRDLSDELWALEGAVMSGEVPLTDAAPDSTQPPQAAEGIMDFESSFDSYPKLIYDGPFSDNILEKTPELTKKASQVSQDTALIRAAAALGTNTSALTREAETGGRLPSYRYCDDEGRGCCEVTKAGGFLSYMLRMREVYDEGISREQAVQAAEDYLRELGVVSMEVTYYEITDNIMTVNLCYSDNGIRIYPDLAKVMIAMDNGEVLGYDGTGYIVNHRARDLEGDRISLSRAKREVSSRLMLEGQRLAVIPTDGGNERFCWEFTCKASTGRRVLVYIDAENAQCADILMLEENENGVLTL